MFFRFVQRSKYDKKLDMKTVARREVAVMAPRIWPSVMRDVAQRVLEKAGAAR